MQLDGMPKTHLIVAIPACGRMSTIRWGINLALQEYPLSMGVNFLKVEGAEAGEARNQIVKQVQDVKSKIVWMVDDDVLPPPYAVQKLLYAMMANPKVMACAGIVYTKSAVPSPLVFNNDGEGPYLDWKRGKVFEVPGFISTGCMLIKMEVFEKLEYPWFKTKEYPDRMTEDVYFCFPPDQYVYGDVLPVEQYEVGDKVVADTGRIRKVLDTVHREYKGELVKVAPNYGAGFECTPAHKIQVIRSSKKQWIEAQNLTTSDKLVVPFPSKYSLGHDTNALAVWPYIRNKNVEFKDAKFRYTRTHKDSQWFPLKITANADFCSLAGYWVAEGCASGDLVTFNFNTKEVEYADDVQRLLKKCFDLDSIQTDYPDTAVRVVSCSNAGLADFLVGTFGKLSSQRFVPEEIMRSQENCMKAFLKSHWRGDGDKADYYRLTTTSKRLAHNIRWMLIRLGIYCSLSETENEKHNTAYTLSPAGQFHKEWCSIIEQTPLSRKRELKQSNLTRLGSIWEGGEFHVGIKSVLFIPYEGIVHNLKIAVDETYNINGFSVHNCQNVIKAGYKILGHGGVLCGHYDSRTRKVVNAPEDPVLNL